MCRGSSCAVCVSLHRQWLLQRRDWEHSRRIQKSALRNLSHWILGYAKVCVQNGPEKTKFQKKMLENVLDADGGEWEE